MIILFISKDLFHNLLLIPIGYHIWLCWWANYSLSWFACIRLGHLLWRWRPRRIILSISLAQAAIHTKTVLSEWNLWLLLLLTSRGSWLLFSRHIVIISRARRKSRLLHVSGEKDWLILSSRRSQILCCCRFHLQLLLFCTLIVTNQRAPINANVFLDHVLIVSTACYLTSILLLLSRHHHLRLAAIITFILLKFNDLLVWKVSWFPDITFLFNELLPPSAVDTFWLLNRYLVFSVELVLFLILASSTLNRSGAGPCAKII